MAKGDIYLHSEFKFSDGTIGRKYFVILYEPDSDESPYLVIKTTSKISGTFKIGCNEKRKAFFIPKNNNPVFPADTLLQLHEIFEISTAEFLKGCITEQVIDHKGVLANVTISELINCIKKLKEDISEEHFELITKH